ncbi:MAG: hypothetical protein IIA87_03220 [Nanoarchaeota archaeon]|nr:hypothetical protein [Nanoarchaeota archaeon]
MNYYKYIQSANWIEKSKKWILISNGCEKCGSFNSLTSHHKNYKTLGHERRKDIRVLCWECHKKYHLVNFKRIFVKDMETNLKQSREEFKKYVKEVQKGNEMITQFIQKGKIRGMSKRKSKEMVKLLKG